MYPHDPALRRRWCRIAWSLALAAASVGGVQAASEARMGRALVDDLLLRQGPGTRNPVLGSVDAGDVLPVLGSTDNHLDNRWIEVEPRPGQRAWVYGKYLAVVVREDTADTATAAPQSPASDDEQQTAQAPAGEHQQNFQRSDQAAASASPMAEQSRQAAVGPVPTAGTPARVAAARSLNLRAAADPRADVLDVLQGGDPVRILGRDRSPSGAPWYRVRTADAIVGYAYAPYIEPLDQPVAEDAAPGPAAEASPDAGQAASVSSGESAQQRPRAADPYAPFELTRHLMRAEALREQGRLEASAEVYRDLIDRGHQSERLTMNLMALYGRMGEANRARSLVAQLPQQRAERLWFAWGVSALRAGQDSTLVTHVLQQRFSIPAPAPIAFLYGVCAEREQQYEEALRWYELAMRRQRSNHYFAYAYARMLQYQGRTQEAVRLYQRILREPDQGLAEVIRPYLRRVMG